MPVVETISIINKSGKVVSTTKHLVNIFKDAKEAYQEKKAEIRAEIFQKHEEKAARKMIKHIRLEEVQSETSTRRAYRHRPQSKGVDAPKRPALTERNLTSASESDAPSPRRTSHHGGERSPRSPHSPRSPTMYRAPYFETADVSRPELSRRHTESLQLEPAVYRPAYSPPKRTMSSPTFSDDIDMHMAYGDLPHDLQMTHHPSDPKEVEVQVLMSKLDKLMLEAQCIQHSAATIITSLQANPEAMAAVALTLAELSNILTKMSPGILTALKGSSPAIFALLASPQFLIAGGVAVGVTIVMFGGYKIIKKIQANAAERKDAARMDEALVYEGGDLSSIESWRRGIADEEARSVATSVDGEFITPEAARVKRERIRERAKEERAKGERPTKDRSSSIKRKDGPARSSTARTVISEASSTSTVKPSRKEGKELVIREKKAKKPSALTVLFKKSMAAGKAEKEKERVRAKSVESYKPRLLEM